MLVVVAAVEETGVVGVAGIAGSTADGGPPVVDDVVTCGVVGVVGTWTGVAT